MGENGDLYIGKHHVFRPEVTLFLSMRMKSNIYYLIQSDGQLTLSKYCILV